MERPNDIPEDVWGYVLFKVMPRDLIGSILGDDVHVATCRAILKEREVMRARHSAIVAAISLDRGEPEIGDEIIAAIRSGAPHHHEIRDLGSFVAERNAGKE